MDKKNLVVEKLDILPLSIYEFKLPTDLFNSIKKHIRDIDELEFTLRDNKPYYGKSILGNKSLHNNEKYKDLKKYIEDCLELIREEQSFDYIEQLKVCLLWANKSSKDQWHHGHKHPWSILSGIIYLQGESGETWFSREDDYTQIMTWLLRDESKNNHIIHRHKPKEGYMVVFPSNLMHSVSENRNEEERITISFNSFPQGCVGDIEALSGLRISVN